jgi:hypothetical protein
LKRNRDSKEYLKKKGIVHNKQTITTLLV